MQKTDSKTLQKDIEKGQKILAALYVLTAHLSENDPIRLQLRSLATAFVCADRVTAIDCALQIEILLGGAVFAGLIGEKNSSVIIYEVKRFCDDRNTHDSSATLIDFFPEADTFSGDHIRHIKDNKKTSSHGLVRSDHQIGETKKQISLSSKGSVRKQSRQETILSFINDRKSAVIKDIISLLPDVSEKTIQRELATLVDTGRITKRGSKRWSIYMAVNSLL